MNNPAHDHSDHAHSLASILTNTSAALHKLHELVLDVELQILENTSGDRQAGADTTHLQSLDLLSQSTQEIGLMLARLTQVVPKTATVDTSRIIDPIRLEQLRDLIANGPFESGKNNGGQSDISLF